MKKIIFTLIVLSAVMPVCYAQVQMDTIVKHAASAFMENPAKPGISIGVVQNGQIYKYHFGTAQKKLDRAATDQTIYEIGSLTKTFTSFLLAQAVTEKKASLTDDIRKYLDKGYPNLAFEGKPIQLLYLANLTSGLPDNLPENAPEFKNSNPDSMAYVMAAVHNNYSKKDFLSDLHQVKLIEAPGSIAPRHSNTAAQLLGYILENIYGMDYDSLLKKYLGKSLKLEHTFMAVPVNQQALLAKGYNAKGGEMPLIPHDAAGAGGLRSSLGDMANYLRFQLEESDEAIKLTHQITGNAIGLNWMIGTFDKKRKLSASGSTFGFASYLLLYPDQHFGVVLLSNESGPGAEDALGNTAKMIFEEANYTLEQRSSDAFGFSPYFQTLLTALNRQGFEHATEVAAALKKADPDFYISEGGVNAWANFLSNKGKKTEALEIFKLNTSLYPQSSYACDNYARQLENAGKKEDAVKWFNKALSLNPKDGNAAEHLKQLNNK